MEMFFWVLFGFCILGALYLLLVECGDCGSSSSGRKKCSGFDFDFDVDGGDD